MRFITPLLLLWWAAWLPADIRAAVPADRIRGLPHLSGDIGVQYSGYFDIGEGKFMHYVFAQARANASQLPLVLWLNGGPGCSSLDGYFYEQGPFWFDDDDAKDLEPNPWSWLRVANMLFLESPAGVGFSFSSQPYVPNDNSTADDNYRFLKRWFQAYPEFAQNDFYISGESYAGIYVPMLSYRCAQDKSINFKGMAVGNGVTDDTMSPLADKALYLYKIGATSQSQWDAIVAACGDREDTPECEAALDAGAASFGGYNVYNVFGTCYSQRPSPGASRLQKFAPSSRQPLKEIPPCLDAFAAEAYLNRPDVQKALHVRRTKWDICADDVVFRYVKNRPTMKAEYQYLMQAGYRILVYNGDNDAACPYTGNEYFIRRVLQATPKGKRDWESWTYTSPVGTQVGGHVTYFEQGLTFTTVIGAGHMVPQYKPEAALAMFQRWLNGEDF
eukprot:EG_transcript_9562